jgi:adenine-specific DNA-methyltransferase
MINPFTSKEVNHPERAWKFEKAHYDEYVCDNKLYWGIDGKNTYPRLKNNFVVATVRPAWSR